MKKNYSYLEGKIIKYFNGSVEYRAKVALIDPDIGITIINADNPEHYLSCLIMPSSPKWKKKWNNEIEAAKSDFKKFVKCIEDGEFNAIKDTKVTVEDYLRGKVTLDASSCPFI